MAISFYMAFRSLGQDLDSFLYQIKRSSLIDIVRNGMFFEVMEFFCMACMDLHGNLASIYESHKIIIFHKQPHRHMIFQHNRLHLHFCHRSKTLNVFSCKENIIHSGSFFSIYAYHISNTFNIFFHIGRLLFLHYIQPSFKFSHNYTSLSIPHNRMVGIFHYDIVEDINEDNRFRAFFDKVYRKNVARDPYRIRDF